MKDYKEDYLKISFEEDSSKEATTRKKLKEEISYTIISKELNSKEEDMKIILKILWNYTHLCYNGNIWIKASRSKK